MRRSATASADRRRFRLQAWPGRSLRALSLDGLGTLLRLEPPVPRLRDALASRFGIALALPMVERALAAEIAYYRAHHLEGHNQTALADLRRRCARVLDAELPELRCVEPDVEARETGLLEALLEALVFTPYADAARLVKICGERGLAVVVTSNWDCGLRDVIARLGLSQNLCAIVTSAEVGVAKPDAAVFARAAEAAGVATHELLHVGDDPYADLAGARLAGAFALLVDRHGAHYEAFHRVAALDELGSLLSHL